MKKKLGCLVLFVFLVSVSFAVAEELSEADGGTAFEEPTVLPDSSIEKDCSGFWGAINCFLFGSVGQYVKSIGSDSR